MVVALQAATVKSATTKWAAALTEQLLARHGVLTREAVTAEAVAGGFGIVYPALKGLEETGRIRRGYFVAGLGATQFAMPGALDLLRSLRDAPDEADAAEARWPAGVCEEGESVVSYCLLPHRSNRTVARF